MADKEQMRRQLGVSRRDLLRRGAIVGGTLLWTIPVVSTLSRAHPNNVKSPAFVCCEFQDGPMRMPLSVSCVEIAPPTSGDEPLM